MGRWGAEIGAFGARVAGKGLSFGVSDGSDGRRGAGPSGGFLPSGWVGGCVSPGCWVLAAMVVRIADDVADSLKVCFVQFWDGSHSQLEFGAEGAREEATLERTGYRPYMDHGPGPLHAVVMCCVEAPFLPIEGPQHWACRPSASAD